MRAWLVLLLVPLAGCFDADPPPPAGDEPDERTLAARALDDAPPIDWDVSGAVDWWEHISTEYPKHDANTPFNQFLRQYLIDELTRIGMNVEVRSYATSYAGVDLPNVEQPLLQYHVVIGTKQGNVDERIGLVAHYDTQTTTVMGAYDDASGVAAQFHICEAMAKNELNHTLACIFFDAEERGLVASQKYVEDAVVTGEHPYDYVLGYDMTGINWPGHEWNMYMMTGPDEDIPWLVRLGQEVMHVHQGYPIGDQAAGVSGVTVLDTHDRNSDERRFKEVGIPIYRFAGGRNAADYPQYHQPQDTVEYVYEFVDGRPNFEAGFRTIVEGSYATAMVLDAYSPDQLRAAYS